MLNSVDNLQKNQQCLFGKVVPSKDSLQNNKAAVSTQSIPQAAVSSQSAANSYIVTAQTANRFTGSQMNFGQGLGPQPGASSNYAQVSQVNKYKQLNNGMLRSSNIKMGDSKSNKSKPPPGVTCTNEVKQIETKRGLGNYQLKTDKIEECVYDQCEQKDMEIKSGRGGTYKVKVCSSSVTQDFIKDRMNEELKNTQTRSKNFEVRGSEDTTEICIEDNFQDESLNSQKTVDFYAPPTRWESDEVVLAKSRQFYNCIMKNNFDILSLSFSRDAKALPYTYDALEPIISMDRVAALHGDKRQTYITNMNKVLLQAEDVLASKNEQRITELAKCFKINYCSYVNQEMFWEGLAPISEFDDVPMGYNNVGDAIKKYFGSVDCLIPQFLDKINSIEGKALGHLVFNKETGALSIHTTDYTELIGDHNDSLISILTIDTQVNADGEQTKSLQDFQTDVWKIINWKKVNRRFRLNDFQYQLSLDAY